MSWQIDWTLQWLLSLWEMCQVLNRDYSVFWQIIHILKCVTVKEIFIMDCLILSSSQVMHILTGHSEDNYAYTDKTVQMGEHIQTNKKRTDWSEVWTYRRSIFPYRLLNSNSVQMLPDTLSLYSQPSWVVPVFPPAVLPRMENQEWLACIVHYVKC